MPALMDTYIENRTTIRPSHANNLDTTHGGNVLKWMDEIGATSAIRFAESDVLTTRMEQTNFGGPIPVGENGVIESGVSKVGDTTMCVQVRTVREGLRTAETERTTESRRVYVAIDESFESRSVPELAVPSDRGKAFREAARESNENDDHEN